jgi:hypothetical protein
MFGKSKQPGASQLNARVRAMTERSGAPPSTTPSALEHPRASRQAVFRAATVILDSGVRFSVAMKDLSGGGARIEFLVRDCLPAEFVLSEPLQRLRRRVRVVWQSQGVAGVRFID